MSHATGGCPFPRALARLLNACTAVLLFGLFAAPAWAQGYLPTGTAAVAGNGIVTVQWNPVPGATSYNVYRGTASHSEGSTPLVIGVTGSASTQDSYADTAVTNGTTYFYFVTTEYFDGESDASKEVSATPGATALAAPALKAMSAPTQVSLSWPAVAGAISYNLYRSTDNDTYLCYLKNLTGTSFGDSQVVPSVTYYYILAAVDKNGQGTNSNTAVGVAGGVAPNAPTALDAYASNSYVSLYWAPSLGANSYNLYRGAAAGKERLYKTGIGDTSYGDSSVTNGTIYYYKVTAVNSYGESAQSNQASAAPGSMQLAAPVFAVSAGSASAVLHWNSVSGATSYNLYRSTDNRNFVSVARGVTTTNYTNTSLANGVTYYFYVSAVSSSGEGSRSNIASVTPGSTSLTAPAGLRISAQNGYNQLYWDAVAGAASYNIYRGTTAGGEGVTPVETGVGFRAFYSDGGLVNGTIYYYTVTAVDSDGESIQSNEASGKPGSAALAAPSLSAVPGNGQATLNWAKVSGAASYGVYESTDDDTFTQVQSGLTTNTDTVTGLTNGVTYYFVAVAVSSAGEGSNSNTVTATPGSLALAAPTGLAVDPDSSDNRLFWNPVPGATSYNIYRGTAAGGEGNAPAITGIGAPNFGGYTDGGLTNGKAYYYTVTAVNANGESIKSVEASATPGSTRLTGTTLAATPGNAQIVLTWSSVTGAAGYNLYRSTDNSTYLSIGRGLTGATYTDTGLINGILYYYLVYAVNSSGEGNGSNTVTATPSNGGATTPAAPINLVAQSASATQIQLSWSPSAAATSYSLYRGTKAGAEGGTPVVTGITGTSYYDGGLAYGTTYYYKIAAANGLIVSSLSGEASATVGGPTLSSPVLSAIPGTTQVTLNWSAVPGAAGYIVERGFSRYGLSLLKTGLTATTLTDTGLTSGVPLYYQVCAVNPDGYGYASNTVSATPGDPAPPAPVGLHVIEYDGATLHLLWNPVIGAQAINIYRSTTPGGEGSIPIITSVGGNATDVYDYGLSNGKTYYYQITSVSIDGESAKSNEANGTTGVTPLAGANLTATAGSAQVTLNWSAVPSAASYSVYRSTDDSSWIQVKSGLTAMSYTDTGLTNGVPYHYVVEAANADGEGRRSNDVVATPKDGLPAAPIGLNATAGNGIVYLSWNPVAGASGYNIYRATAAGGEGSSPYATVGSNGFNDYGVTNATGLYYYNPSCVSV